MNQGRQSTFSSNHTVERRRNRPAHLDSLRGLLHLIDLPKSLAGKGLVVALVSAEASASLKWPSRRLFGTADELQRKMSKKRGKG